MAVKKSYLKLLEPYFAGEEPSLRGKDQHRELDMFCPLHPDGKRSATLDLDKGLWYCAAGCGGGRVVDLIDARDSWVPPQPGRQRNGRRRNGASNGNGHARERITEGTIKGWISSLVTDAGRLEELISRRGIDEDTIESYEIGWDSSKRAYTIPIRGEEGEILNIRRYQFEPEDDRRKIWSVAGMGSPARLYPVDVLQDEPDEVCVGEGEWDALLTSQNGFPCVTRTASAATWDAEWGQWFEGKIVYLIHDMDDAGQAANRKIAKLLKNVASEVHVVHLPYTVEKKHGKDLSDYWLEGHTPEQFRELLNKARAGEQEEQDGIEEVTVADTFDASRRGKPVRVYATIKGRREPNYIIPSRVKFECTRDAGQKCKVCTMNAAGGEALVEVDGSDPMLLKMLGAKEHQVFQTLADAYGVPGGKCPRLTAEEKGSQPVEILFARQAIDRSDVGDAYKTARITAVGNHNTPPNATYRVVGALHPSPHTQESEFLAWEVEPVKTALDSFELTDEQAHTLRVFRPRKGMKPLKRLGLIAQDMSQHVTKIYGRPEMHAAMDLVWHSVLGFDFGKQRIDRGWLELLVVGDTRTGKSETASALARHFQAGEVVNCESASFAGIVGGLQQYGGNQWSISWGAIPLNDRRLVVLDEVSGLSYEDIASMSDVRSRGVAQLTKIQQEATHARTRLVWVGNPREGGMAQYTYGVQAIQPLVGNPEDIARFDLAMTAASHDVASEEINRTHDQSDETEFPSELCALLLRWVWSRRADQVVWAPGSEQAVYAAATRLGAAYVDSPPLVQAASVRIKIARIAVALAARLFSTDDTYQNVHVRKEHVWGAVDFLRRIYSMEGFGYAELSRQKITARQEARANSGDIRKWLMGYPGMATFLRENPSFKRQDLEEVMNMSREESNGVINILFHARMVRKDRGFIYVEPELHVLIREVKR